MVVIGILVGLFVLVVLVVLHELGHAVAARRNGVVVEEFGIGFPPRAWKKRLRSGILLTINWLPLGGFVRLKGEHDAARGKGTYGAASFWVKTKILLAGVTINWVTAAVLFSVLALVGIPKILPHQVTLPFDTVVERSPLAVVKVTEHSPAAQVGLRPGDELVTINGQTLTTAQDLSRATRRLAGQTVILELRRQGRIQQVRPTLKTAAQAQAAGFLGVGSGQSEKLRSTWSAPLAGLATTAQLTYETLKGVGTMFSNLVHGVIGQWFGSEVNKQQARQALSSVGDSVAGPVGILGVLFPAVVESGFWSIVFLAAIISLTLAVMNILPIPALDGGRWVTMVLFRLFRRPLTKEREEAIQATGFLVLLLITVLVTWSDVGKFF